MRWIKKDQQSLCVLYFAAFLNWMSYGLIYPTFAVLMFHDSPFFLPDTHQIMRGVWLGILLSSTPLAQFFFSTLTGSLSDRFGRKSILAATTLLIGIGYLICIEGVWAESLAVLILGRFVTGIGASNLVVINASVADISSSKTKTQHYAYITMANGLGFLVGPYIGGQLSVFGFEYPFIFSAALTLLGLCFILFLFVESLPNIGKTKTTRFGLRQYLQIFRMKALHRLFLAMLIFCLGWSFYWEFIPVTWIKKYALTAPQIGNFYAYGSLFFVLSCAFLIRLIIKRMAPKAIFLGALGLLGLAFFSLLWGNILLYWIFIPLQQFLIALIFPVATTIVSNAASRSRQGEVLGVFQSLQALAFAATPCLGGILLSITESVPVIFGGVAMFVAFFVLRTIKKEVL